MTQRRTFGYTYAGCQFREVIRLIPGGFVFHGKWNIQWADVVGYRAFPDFYTDLALTALASPKPRIALYLRDARVIKIRGDLLVVEGKPMTRDRGIPEAFTDLLKHVRENVVSRWAGPTEEKILFATALVLFASGFSFALGAAVISRAFEPSVPVAMVAGVLLAQAAFILAPFVARRLRRIYILVRSP